MVCEQVIVQMELYRSNDIALWEASLAAYKEIVSLLEQERKKKSASKTGEVEKLTALDKWYFVRMLSICSSYNPEFYLS